MDMKKNNITVLLLSALMTVGLFSACSYSSSDEIQSPDSPSGLVLNIKTSSVGSTRTALTSVTPANEQVVQNMVVGIFKSGGGAASITSYTTAELGTGTSANGLSQNITTSYTSSTAATDEVEVDDEVLVAINVPDARLTDFTGVTTKAAFQALTLSIAEAITHTATGTAIDEDALPMYGEGLVAASGTTFKADVTVIHTVAKVTLASLSVDFSESLHTGAAFKPTEVFLLNVPAATDFDYTWASATDTYTYGFGQIDDVTAPVTNYYTGESTLTTGGTFPTAANAVQAYQADYIGSGALTLSALQTSSTAITTGYTFYTLPNNSDTYNTKLVIKGKYTDDLTLDATGHDAYYAVDLYPDYAGDANDKSIQPNYNYSVTAVICGDGADDAYSDIPDIESVKSTVTALAFDEYQNTVTFNNGGVIYEAQAPAKVGDLYFSDGTWGSAADYPGKTPIAIVFSTDVSAADYTAGYRHGYAMALKRANSGSNVANWCASVGTPNIQSTLITRTTPAEFFNPVTDLMADMEGLTYCNAAIQYCIDNAIDVDNLTAIQAARGYTPAAPANTSGWYLPSIGQQYLWLKNLANAGSDPEGSTTYTGTENWTNNSTYWTRSGESSGAATAINNYCKAKLSSDANKALWEDFAPGHYLWSSTERVAGYPFNLGFTTGGLLYLDGRDDKSNANRRVRAVLAF